MPSHNVLSCIALLLGVGGVATAVAAQQAPAELPPGPGLDLINARCVFCHTTAQVLSVRKPPAEWATTVQVMIDRGAELDPDEQKIMVDYLVANFAEPGDEAHAQP